MKMMIHMIEVDWAMVWTRIESTHANQPIVDRMLSMFYIRFVYEKEVHVANG
jgi:hypothetical protein